MGSLPYLYGIPLRTRPAQRRLSFLEFFSASPPTARSSPAAPLLSPAPEPQREGTMSWHEPAPTKRQWAVKFEIMLDDVLGGASACRESFLWLL